MKTYHVVYIMAYYEVADKSVDVVAPKGSSIYYEYFTTNHLGEDTPAIEVTLTQDGKAIATRKLDKAALRYLIPTNDKVIQDLKFGGF